MKVSKKEMKKMLEALSAKPIAYQPIYSRISGGLANGVLLSQLVYWWFSMREREFYKTNSDFTNETAMRIREFRKAKKSLMEQGFIDVTLKGIPRRSFYKVNIGKIIEEISKSDEKQSLSDNNGVQLSDQ